MIKENIEIWRPVVGYEGYAVSDRGRVKSVERTCKCKCGSVRRVREKMLKPSKDNEDYLNVSLYKNGVKKCFGVHVLVALSFPEICGLPFEGAQCNHIDENHFNNTPENLNWLSVQDNINYGTRNERAAKARANYPHFSKTVYQYTKNYELVKEWQSAHEIERQTGYFATNISACCNGKAKTAYKYIWSYTRL